MEWGVGGPLGEQCGNLVQWKLPGIQKSDPGELSQDKEPELTIFYNQIKFLAVGLVHPTKHLHYICTVCNLCQDNCGTELVRQANQGLVQFKDQTRRRNSCWTLQGYPGTRSWATQRSRVEPYMTGKNQTKPTNETIPNDILLYSKMVPSPIAIREALSSYQLEQIQRLTAKH